MSILSPTYFFKRVIDIDTEFLFKVNCQGLILDIDDTLAPLGCLNPETSVLEWVKRLKEDKIKMVIASNNSQKRVSDFAQILEIPHIYEAKKPFRKGLKKAIEMLSLPKENILMVGDQVFADILGAKFTRINSVLVEPLSPAKNFTLKLKRKLEVSVRKKLQVSNLSDPEYTINTQGVTENEEQKHIITPWS